MKGFSQMDLASIELAHAYTLNAERICEYPAGRGSFGLVYVIDGAAEYRFLSGERARIEKGEVLLLFPCAAYRITTLGDFYHYTVNFSLHNEIDAEEVFWKLAPLDDRTLAHKFGRLCEAWRTRSIAFELRCKGLFYEILCALEQEEHERQGTHGSGLLRAKAYIDTRYAEDFDIAALSRVADMSATNFRRRFREAFGETAMQYRDRVRLDVAKQYLLSGYYNVSEAARAVGFEDVSYFVRFFKRHIGTPPGALIKK